MKRESGPCIDNICCGRYNGAAQEFERSLRKEELKERGLQVAEGEPPAKPSKRLRVMRKSPSGQTYARFNDNLRSYPDRGKGIFWIHLRLYEWSVGEHVHSPAENTECNLRAPLEHKASGAFL